jgi:hypothetical protein
MYISLHLIQNGSKSGIRSQKFKKSTKSAWLLKRNIHLIGMKNSNRNGNMTALQTEFKVGRWRWISGIWGLGCPQFLEKMRGGICHRGMGSHERGALNGMVVLTLCDADPLEETWDDLVERNVGNSSLFLQMEIGMRIELQLNLTSCWWVAEFHSLHLYGDLDLKLQSLKLFDLWGNSWCNLHQKKCQLLWTSLPTRMTINKRKVSMIARTISQSLLPLDKSLGAMRFVSFWNKALRSFFGLEICMDNSN